MTLMNEEEMTVKHDSFCLKGRGKFRYRAAQDIPRRCCFLFIIHAYCDLLDVILSGWQAGTCRTR